AGRFLELGLQTCSLLLFLFLTPLDFLGILHSAMNFFQRVQSSSDLQRLRILLLKVASILPTIPLMRLLTWLMRFMVWKVMITILLTCSVLNFLILSKFSGVGGSLLYFQILLLYSQTLLWTISLTESM